MRFYFKVDISPRVFLRFERLRCQNLSLRIYIHNPTVALQVSWNTTEHQCDFGIQLNANVILMETLTVVQVDIGCKVLAALSTVK